MLKYGFHTMVTCVCKLFTKYFIKGENTNTQQHNLFG